MEIFVPVVEELYGTQDPSSSFPFIITAVSFTACGVFVVFY